MKSAPSERIRALRTKLGLTPQEFGLSVGATARLVAKWETGLATPDTAALARMRKAFNVDVNWLVDAASFRPGYLDEVEARNGKLVELPVRIEKAAEKQLIGTYRKLDDVGRSFIRTVVETVREKSTSTQAAVSTVVAQPNKPKR